MVDREKVIKGLRELHGSKETMELISDAITMLKTQEAVKIKVNKLTESGRCGRCPSCGNELNETDYPHYCGCCGQAVIWNEQTI